MPTRCALPGHDPLFRTRIKTHPTGSAALDIAQITSQPHRQLGHRFQQIVAVNDVPLDILIKAIERVLAIAMLIFTNPRRAVDATDCAHGVEGFAGDGVGHTYNSTPHSGHASCSACRRS